MLLIIDGSALLCKYFYGTVPKEYFKNQDPSLLKTTSYGMYKNGVEGMFKAILRLIENEKPEHIAVCFDETRDTFRRQIFDGYKATRKDAPEPLIEQFDSMAKILRAMGIKIYSSNKYEADDYAGSLCEKFKTKTDIKILTRDNDYLQLVDKNVHVLMMQTNNNLAKDYGEKLGIENTFVFTPDRVKQIIGVKPEQIPDLKGIAGDTSDNIPGIKGINTAAPYLLNYYENIEKMFEDIKVMEQDEQYKKNVVKRWKNSGMSRSPFNKLVADNAKKDCEMSKTLATIVRNIPIDESLNDLRVNLKNLDYVKETILEIK